jgi:linear primary-alkylsulfatase
MTEQKDATQATKDVNRAVAADLPFSDQSAYGEVRRGLLSETPNLFVPSIDGEARDPIWSLLDYKGQMSAPPDPVPACPDTVNPSLWRMATLNSVAGVFQVNDGGGIYQVRAFDMSNMTIVVAPEGLIIIDPLISTECAGRALRLFRAQQSITGHDAPVAAVIYTHSHVDHFGGVRGVVSDNDVANGVKIYAPAGFLEHAVSENVYAGTAMGRRAQYMYGPYLTRNNRGQIDCGLGKNQSTGSISLIAPTDDITENTTYQIAGLPVEFQLTPGSEAPAEMNFYFPDYRALCAAENTTHNMHNIQTLRGARVRDALAWSKYLNEAIDKFGNRTDVLFAQHHWPVWDNSAPGGAMTRQQVLGFMRKQRDMYRYLNDQTLRLLNQGYTGIEIAESFVLPPGLDQDWSCRGYYGSVSHNVKAVYDRYMGWFDGNPSNLHALPPSECAAKYVDIMGGADNVIARATDAFNAGEYRWVAQLLSHVVFADPTNTAAAQLQADALEQMGYQAEPATWRNFFLMGAQELRGGIQAQEPKTSPDMITQLTDDMVFDLFACSIDGMRAAARNLVMNWLIAHPATPTEPAKTEQYLVEVSNGALSCTAGKQAAQSDVTVSITRDALNQIMLGRETPQHAIEQGDLKITGDSNALAWFVGLLDAGDPNFPIVTPRDPALPEMAAPAPGEVNAGQIMARTWRLAPPMLKGC